MTCKSYSILVVCSRALWHDAQWFPGRDKIWKLASGLLGFNRGSDLKISHELFKGDNFKDHDNTNVGVKSIRKKVLCSKFSLELESLGNKFCFTQARICWLSIKPLQMQTTVYTNINCVFNMFKLENNIVKMLNVLMCRQTLNHIKGRTLKLLFCFIFTVLLFNVYKR